MQAFEIFFLNNGSAVFQTDDFCHAYDDMDHLAADFVEYQNSGSTGDWEGNEPEFRVTYDFQAERNGAYFCVTDLSWELNEDFGNNVSDFSDALRAVNYMS